jgi:hypothetical protein
VFTKTAKRLFVLAANPKWVFFLARVVIRTMTKVKLVNFCFEFKSSAKPAKGIYAKEAFVTLMRVAAVRSSYKSDV